MKNVIKAIYNHVKVMGRNFCRGLYIAVNLGVITVRSGQESVNRSKFKTE